MMRFNWKIMNSAAFTLVIFCGMAYADFGAYGPNGEGRLLWYYKPEGSDVFDWCQPAIVYNEKTGKRTIIYGEGDEVGGGRLYAIDADTHKAVWGPVGSDTAEDTANDLSDNVGGDISDNTAVDVPDDTGDTLTGDEDNGDATDSTPDPSQTPGWTKLSPSADSKIVYVSQSEGNDANSGSQQQPCKTIAHGVSLLRDGYPDWLLLKRGDEWTETLGDEWTKSGRSASEPMVLASYGNSTKRPVIRTGQTNGFLIAWALEWGSTGKLPQNISIVGLHFLAHTNDHRSRDKAGNPITDLATPYEDLSFVANDLTGIWIAGPVANLLLEDCRIESYGTGIVVQGNSSGNPNQAVLRRNIVIDNYADRDNSQGVYLAGIKGLRLEENLIDYNGWHEGVSLWTFFDHSAYIAYGSFGAQIRGNIVSRSDGIQARDGGTVEDNLLVRTAIGLTVGIYQYGVASKNVSGLIRNNVFLEGASFSGLPRANGIAIGNISKPGLEIHNNIFANSLGNGNFFQVAPYNDPGVGVHNVNFHDNISYDWGNGISLVNNNDKQPDPHTNIRIQNNIFQDTRQWSRFYSVFAANGGLADVSAYKLKNNTYFTTLPKSEFARIDAKLHDFGSWTSKIGETGSKFAKVKFLDPQRTTATYNASLNGPASFEAFIAEVRKQSKGSGMGIRGDGSFGTLPGNASTWRQAYTAKAVNAYIREGFKIKENSGRVHEIIKKNGVPTEYHVLKGKKHYDVYKGQSLDDILKLEISWFDKYLKGDK